MVDTVNVEYMRGWLSGMAGLPYRAPVDSGDRDAYERGYLQGAADYRLIWGSTEKAH